MKNKDSQIINVQKNGELSLNVHHLNKYQEANIFLKGFVPTFLIIMCVVIDIAFFFNLFQKISYDSPISIALEVAGLAFAADIVSVYAGIVMKQIRQKLNNEKGVLYLLIGVVGFALIINGVLRLSTMSLSTIDGSIDARSIALTIIGIVTPIFTSLGNFAISYFTYNPLGEHLYRLEVELQKVREAKRQAKALISDYEYNDAERLIDLDYKKLNNAKLDLINDAFIALSEVHLTMMEYLGDPSSTNVLSKSDFDRITNRLNKELNKMKCIVESEITLNKEEIINPTTIA